MGKGRSNWKRWVPHWECRECGWRNIESNTHCGGEGTSHGCNVARKQQRSGWLPLPLSKDLQRAIDEQGEGRMPVRMRSETNLPSAARHGNALSSAFRYECLSQQNNVKNLSMKAFRDKTRGKASHTKVTLTVHCTNGTSWTVTKNGRGTALTERRVLKCAQKKLGQKRKKTANNTNPPFPINRKSPDLIKQRLLNDAIGKKSDKMTSAKILERRKRFGVHEEIQAPTISGKQAAPLQCTTPKPKYNQ